MMVPPKDTQSPKMAAAEFNLPLPAAHHAEIARPFASSPFLPFRK
jgi:hypothetical protein